MRIIRWLIVLLILLVLAAIVVFAIVPGKLERSLNRVEAHSPYSIEPDVQKLHASLTIGDLHADSTLWDRDLLQRSDRGQVDIPRLQEGNVALQVFTSVTRSPKGKNYNSTDGDAPDDITLVALLHRWPIATWDSLVARAEYQAQRLHELEARAPDQFKVIETRADLDAVLAQRAVGKKVVGGLLGTEGSHALDGKLENIDTLYKAGFRMMGLHHFFDNRLGGSLHGTAGGGLTEFGRKVVKAIVAKPIVLDVAHSSAQVVEEVLALSNKPVVLSHTGFSGHCKTQRNIDDTLMQKIAAQGGLIGVGYWPDVTCGSSPAQIVSAIRYGVDLLGAEHVALGSDFDGTVTTSFDTSELSVITQEMVKAGFTDREIRLVMGDNLVRVLRQQLPLN